MRHYDRDGFAPGGPWSLLEMLQHDAEAFCRFSSGIGQMLVILEVPLGPNWTQMVDVLSGLQREAARMNMRGVVRVLDRIKEHMTARGGGASPATVRPMILELYNRMQDDLGDLLFLQIPESDAALYTQKTPLFGVEVQSKFPVAIYDIKEAGKCLALERSTAGAFHSIRCIEAGIRAMARCLGIPDPTKGSERSWNNILRTISNEMERRWPKAAGSSRMSGDGKYFEEAYAALAAMQNPYRNSTMHLDEKYTPEEAAHIFEMSKGFMRRLASRMDENGLPLA